MKSKAFSIPFRSGKIHYDSYGNRGPAVVLLHGFLESRTMWSNYAKRLCSSRRVVCIDLPGHGKSSSYGYVQSMDLMAQAVNAVLKNENIRRAVFIGHSMGGYTALALAEFAPEKIKGLNLFFSTALADTAELKAGRDRSKLLVQQDHKKFIRRAIPLLFRPKNRALFRTEIAALKKAALKTTQQSVLATLEGLKQRPDREIVVRFAPFPVHYTIGRFDPVLPYQQLIDQTRHGDHLSYTLVPKIGHMGFIEAEETCFKDIRRFINRC